MRFEDPAMAEWKDLLDGLKDSNRQQADHIEMKLRQVGCAVRKVTGRKIKLVKFTKAEVELLAEMEHGRWNAERLLDGWTWGPKKDVVKKVSPYLVTWSELPWDVKDWDRKTVSQIPAFLAKVGLEIRRL